MATVSGVLAWRIPWTEEPGELWSIGAQTVGCDKQLSTVWPGHTTPLEGQFIKNRPGIGTQII